MPLEQRRSWLTRLVNGVAIATVFWVCAVLVLVRLLGDRWWIGTIVLFAPRWLLALPNLFGILLLPWLTRRVKCAVLVSVLAASWGVLGLCVPWSGWFSQPKITYRTLTCNVAGWSGSTKRLEQLILDSRVDVVMLQECKDQSKFPLPNGWFSCAENQLLIASRYPLSRVRFVKDKGRWPTANGLFCEAQTPEGAIPLGCVHIASPRYGLSNVVDSKTILAPSRRTLLIKQTVQRQSQSKRASEVASYPEGAMVVGGDFNMPVESYFFRKHWRSFRDAYSEAGFGLGHTTSVGIREIYWGARIDHILTRGRCHSLRCWVGPDVESDHLPVLADIYLE
jgi:vancomycin resistance protein VanJ